MGGDMFDALERQQNMAAARSTASKLPKVNTTVLAVSAKQAFKQADFSSSGKIDTDEAKELLDQIAWQGGFSVPDHKAVNAHLSAHMLTRKGWLNIDEFIAFIKDIASGKEPPDIPPPSPPQPSTPTMAAASVASPAKDSAVKAEPALPPPSPVPMSTPASPPVVNVVPEPPRTGYLRVSLLEADGLSPRSDGSPREPYAVVAINEPTRRRTRRSSSCTVGTTAPWAETFDFDRTSLDAQVVVDVLDDDGRGGAGLPAELLGKAVVDVGTCKPGVPHLFITQLWLLGGTGQLALRLTFDYQELPSY